MHRRDFLTSTCSTSLAMLLPFGASSQAQGEALNYRGPFFINLHAWGGWDPTMSFDPKPSLNRLVQGNTVERLSTNGAPFVNLDFMEPGTPNIRIASLGDFMRNFGRRFVVLNGIDTATNNHEIGLQLLASGRANEPIPAFAALAAARVATERELPLAFIGAGGFEYTGNVVSLSRLSPSSLAELGFPERTNPSVPGTSALDRVSMQKVLERRTRSLDAQLRAASLPRTKAALAALREARSRTGTLHVLAEALPRPNGALQMVRAETHFPHLAPMSYAFSDLTAAMQQVELTLLAFQKGLAASASLAFGNFDTHADHDRQHQRHMGRLLLLLQYLFTKTEQLGLSDQLYLAVTSDFGRTPRYNENDGKDHWNVTSALLSAPASVLKTAGGVVGASDPNHAPLGITAKGQTLAIGTKGSTRLKPAHLHRVLRQAFGVTKTALEDRYPLPPEPFEVPILEAG